MQRFLLPLVLCLAAVPVWAGDVTLVDLRTEPEPVAFGGRVELVVEIERDTSARVALPTELPDTPELRRIGAAVRATVPLQGQPERVRETFRVPFLALDYEDVKTPALVLTVEGGEPIELAAAAVTVQTEEGREDLAPPTPQELASILAPAAPEARFAVLDARPLVTLFALLFGAFALLAYVVLARRRQVRVPVAAPVVAVTAPPRAAHEVALARLDALLEEGLLARGEVAPFVGRLMDEVLREYLELRYDVAAGRRTTSELAQDLLSTGAPGLDLNLVRRLLDDADMVKFARAELATDVAHGMAQQTRALIEHTAPQEVAA